jgi:hypothetical protein
MKLRRADWRRICRQIGFAEPFRDAPVYNQHLSERPKHDILRLDIAVHDAEIVGISNGIAHLNESPQQAAKLEFTLAGVALLAANRVEALNRSFQVLAPNEPHGIIRATVRVLPKAIHWDNAGMLKVAGDLSLEQKAGTTRGLVGMPALDFLQRDFTVQLQVVRDENLAQSASGV